MGFLINENGTRLLTEAGGRFWLEDTQWIYLKDALASAVVHDNQPKDMTRGEGTSSSETIFTLTASGSNIPAYQSGTTGLAWYSERITAVTTLTGLTFRHHATVADGTADAGTLRVRVWVMASGPEHEERLIADYLGGALPVGVYTDTRAWSVLTTPVTLSVGERLVLRVTAEPLPGIQMEAGQITMFVAGPHTGFAPADVALITEPDLPMRENRTRLYLRRTTTIGIGAFMDLLPTSVEQIPVTAVVNTFAGTSGETQWTATAGGAVVEWVSPRFLESWYFDNATLMVNGSPHTIDRLLGVAFAIESNTAANAFNIARVFRRRGSVETECLHFVDSIQLPLVYQDSSDPDVVRVNIQSDVVVQGVTLTPMDFQPDDRLVLRLYIGPRSGFTMASGHTATLSYDGTATQSYLDILETGRLKAEADLVTPPTVPGGDMMMGTAN